MLIIFGNLLAQENKVDLGIIASNLENEVDLPIFGDNDTDLNSKDLSSLSFFNITDLVTLFLFFLFFLICVFLCKKMIINYKKTKNDSKLDFIKEIAFYEIDNKNSIRIINILGVIYIFLISSHSSVLLREIRQGEGLENLDFELDKSNSSNTNSFKLIFNKILRKHNQDDSSLDETEYAELENDIETSLKSKQDRLKKF
ncbi:flagellar biosynthesis protein FliZ [Borrelia sp. HM]|nr:flagellar biosynthesis protein FliZ [Borrelia sp. HM]